MARQIDAGKQRHWLDLMRLWEQAKLSVRAFCGRHRLSVLRFYWWQRTLRERGLWRKASANDAEMKTPAFVQVAVDTAVAAPRSIELVLANGRKLRIRPGFDVNTLRKLLHVLEERPC
jgi:transposase